MVFNNPRGSMHANPRTHIHTHVRARAHQHPHENDFKKPGVSGKKFMNRNFYHDTIFTFGNVYTFVFI